ncbi:hypothetical protein AXG93_2490s1360 [Marchantia polymorpha subsp. ruderalis]|uniref:TRAF3-interacting protein 1 N-terminal domain-containing protein n=1 Tax=Marchantia polymorpha subsp. ruderalis TaxID=1480154 RepID=A0A176W7H4_MARPO|nr:hypothetical protein AXG93_2490s1360 [Marchantia polymorpha subsp. ruderalis]
MSRDLQEKESKVAYLWKIVDCVGITLNTNVPARPLKIVAGLEPEQTNVFLQASTFILLVIKNGRMRQERDTEGKKEKKMEFSFATKSYLNLLVGIIEAVRDAAAGKKLIR